LAEWDTAGLAGRPGRPRGQDRRAKRGSAGSPIVRPTTNKPVIPNGYSRGGPAFLGGTGAAGKQQVPRQLRCTE